MTAAEVKQKLRSRHPAVATSNSVTIPGPWTILEEFMGIDVLAIAATSSPRMGSHSGPRYGRVGYEVKVSRGDMRTELLNPSKRAGAVLFCHEFYFAVPAGMLAKEELEFEEPEHFQHGSAFARALCTDKHCFVYQGRSRRKRSSYHDPENPDLKTCPACSGRGYVGKSRVELEAPTLWIPRDVGLVEVGDRGVRLIKRAPRRTVQPMTDQQVGTMARWISLRPDERHVGLIQKLRDRAKAFRALDRTWDAGEREQILSRLG